MYCRNGPEVLEVFDDQDKSDILDVRVCRVVRKADCIINVKLSGQAGFLKVDMTSQASLPPCLS